MFEFKLEPEISLLTVVRTGWWTLDTVVSYETALRQHLRELNFGGGATAFIIDTRASGAQARDVAEALRAMVARLGPLNAKRTAVVAASGIAKLQARRVADSSAEVFTSMVPARDWALGNDARKPARGMIHDEPGEATAEGQSVHIQGPSDVDISLTPAAALETAKRIGNAAVEALLDHATSPVAITVT